MAAGAPSGLALGKIDYRLPPLLLETSTPGVFAAGDVRYRSVKRAASASGKGAIAVQLLHEYMQADSQEPGPTPVAPPRRVPR